MMNKSQEFETIYQTHIKALYGYFALCFSRDQAADCAQQLFEKLWRYMNRADYHPPENWKAWLFAVAVNEKNDLLRTTKRRLQTVSWSGEEGEADREPTAPMPDMVENEAVRQAFKALSQEERELLLLRANGFTGEEISALIGLNASTLRGRMATAKKRFAETLQENGVNIVKE